MRRIARQGDAAKRPALDRVLVHHRVFENDIGAADQFGNIEPIEAPALIEMNEVVEPARFVPVVLLLAAGLTAQEGIRSGKLKTVDADKGVVVIGQNVWDDDSNVPAFVKKMGDKMTYRVALDDKSQETNGFMSEHWWKRKVNNHTIPHAFIINKEGHIA